VMMRRPNGFDESTQLAGSPDICWLCWSGYPHQSTVISHLQLLFPIAHNKAPNKWLIYLANPVGIHIATPW